MRKIRRNEFQINHESKINFHEICGVILHLQKLKIMYEQKRKVRSNCIE